ncbi:MAG: DUF1150 domain-containing protein [Lactobacillales bacterium]|jgi:hypothetical protein|nr:DUF1150 domain-containing protein [Lactobacillales bacterium]
MAKKYPPRKKRPYESASFGLNGVENVYIKQEEIENEKVWAIYNVAGEQVAYTATRESAVALITQNDFNAMSVH